MADWQLRFLGVGNAQAVELGSAAAVLEHLGEPWLLIDCGQEALSAYLARYRQPPMALFITHVHLDHIAGLERLFFRLYFDPQRRAGCRLYVPAAVVPLLQARIADYPGVLAEGGANYWDAFQLIPVGRGFWHRRHWLEVFPVRHHMPDTAFGLALPGSLVFTGDTRPIPEQLQLHGGRDELIAHDCGVQGNPSHTGLDDLEREYGPELRARLLLYHYGSAQDAATLRAAGYRVAEAGGVIELPSPSAPALDAN